MHLHLLKKSARLWISIQSTQFNYHNLIIQSRFIKSLATELSHLRNMLNVEASEDERLDAGIIEEVKEEYVSMREP